MKENGYEEIEREVQILKSLNHPNINKLIEHDNEGSINVEPSGIEMDNVSYMMLEFVAGVPCYKLSAKVGALGEDIGLYLMRQMVDLIEYMHSKEVVHRDLKLGNLILSKSL